MFGMMSQGAGYGYGAQQFNPLGGAQGIAGYGNPTSQTSLPLTIGAGNVPFGGQQGQFGSSQVQVLPVLTPQGWVGLLVPVGGQQFGGQQFGGQPFGQQPFGQQPFGQQPFGQQQFGGMGGGIPGLGSGYGTPQISPQSVMGGILPQLLQQIPQLQQQIPQLLQQIPQLQQQIPQLQSQIPQPYLPIVPIGATPFGGQQSFTGQQPFTGQQSFGGQLPFGTGSVH